MGRLWECLPWKTEYKAAISRLERCLLITLCSVTQLPRCSGITDVLWLFQELFPKYGIILIFFFPSWFLSVMLIIWTMEVLSHAQTYKSWNVLCSLKEATLVNNCYFLHRAYPSKIILLYQSWKEILCFMFYAILVLIHRTITVLHGCFYTDHLWPSRGSFCL